MNTIYPRSPKQLLGGYAHLARMIDKARAKAAGTLGEYIYPCPLDQALLEFLGLDADAVFDVAKRGTDDEVLRWGQERATPRSAKDIAAWNQTFFARKPTDEKKLQYFIEIRNRVAPHRTDVTTWVDLLDLEEGR
ncbi:MAG TPA: DUF5069 domain-containing protein [Nitrospiria bacterium]|nr:DUF5069 domain-containing protein [Nitrospiria bacterium]